MQDDAQAALYRKALGRSEGRAETALARLLEAGRGTKRAGDKPDGDAPRVRKPPVVHIKDIDPTCGDFDYPNQIFEISI